ncbi:hypothetical protein K030075H31_06480 [Blautia producta]
MSIHVVMRKAMNIIIHAVMKKHMNITHTIMMKRANVLPVQ